MKSREFVVFVAKNPPKTMTEMLLKAQKYMNAKDALTAIEGVEKAQGEKEREGRRQKRTKKGSSKSPKC